MGSIDVALIRGSVDNPDAVNSETIPCRYLSPFYGVTSINFETGANGVTSYDDTQKSYGFWMVPPDVGTKVMVVFVDGDTTQGYWIGCVQDRFMNHMVPGYAALNTTVSSAQMTNYGLPGNTALLPVAEYNKTAYGKASFTSPDDPATVRPVHPFADVLKAQGLLQDKIRGLTSSSARREVPSMVFGISTPGPLDKNGPQAELTYDGVTGAVPSSRLGGSSFVMDDGDVDGENELIRIRTRTGHQILMHNTKDLIYINNSQGTAWIEMTSNGKIDIYAQDSISIHSEADFNFRADRDINFDAGGNVNLHAFGNLFLNAEQNVNMKAGAKAVLGATTGFDITTGAELKLGGAASIDIASNAVRIGLGGTLEITGKTTFSGPKEFKGSTTPANTPDTPTDLPTFTVSGGGNVGGSFISTLQRIPLHEPWAQHEDTDPELYSAASTNANPAAVEANPDGSRPRSANSAPSAGVGSAVQGAVSAAPSVDASGAIAWSQGKDKGPERYKMMTSDTQRQFSAMAVDFLKRRGRPITVNSTVRTEEEQREIYNAWRRAGGDYKTKPKAGGYATPVNPDQVISQGPPQVRAQSPHMRKIALDLKQSDAEDLARTTYADLGGKTLLAQYGFRWQGPTDPYHIQLASVVLPSNDPLNGGYKGVFVALYGGLKGVADSDMKNIAAEINKMPDHKAVFYPVGSEGSSVSAITNNLGPVVLIGFSKGCEVVRDYAPQVKSVVLALFIDAYYTVLLDKRMTSAGLPQSIRRAVSWYSKASAWPADFKSRPVSSGGRLTSIEIPGDKYIHNILPARLAPDILTYVKAVKPTSSGTD